MIITVLVFERYRYLTIMHTSTRIIHIFGTMSTSGRNDSKTTKVLTVIINVWETRIRRLQQRKIPGKKQITKTIFRKFGLMRKQRGEPSSDSERKASSEWECFSPASKAGRKKARTWWTKCSKISKRPENSLQTVNVKEHTASGHKKEPKNINKKNC